MRSAWIRAGAWIGAFVLVLGAPACGASSGSSSNGGVTRYDKNGKAVKPKSKPKPKPKSKYSIKISPPSVNDKPGKGSERTCRVTNYGGPDDAVNDFTASKEPFDAYAMAAAHRTLPFGSEVTVTNLVNGKKVTVRVNDSGPSSDRKFRRICLDLTYGAFAKIAKTTEGWIPAKVHVDSLGDGKYHPPP